MFNIGDKVRVKKDGRVGTIREVHGHGNAVGTSSHATVVDRYLVRFGNEISPGESFTAEELVIAEDAAGKR
jgi:hypothetical protein